MNTDEDHLKENHGDTARFLRRRRASSLRQLEATIATPQGEEQDREQWEELHCRTSTTSNNNSNDGGGYGPGWEPVVSEYLPEQGDLSSPESIATSTALLHPTISVVGTNFCADGNETNFEFQHFRYQAIPFHQQQPPQGWYVNCCDSPQQLDSNSYLDSPISDDCPLVILDLTLSSQNMVNAQIAVSSIAAFLSLSTILAMTLPLFKKRRREKASTYNLYLVFMAAPDLIYNLFLVFLFVEFDKLTCTRKATGFPRINHGFDLAFFIGCAVASLYINATIAYEILKLLRNSKKRKRSQAPTLKKASMQAGFFYAVGITVALLDVYCGDDLKELPSWVNWLLVFPPVIGFPIFYVIYVCIRIWREQLLGERGTKAGKRLNVLFRYFARLVVVYVFIFFTAAILYSLQWYGGGLYYWWGCMLYALQVWVSFIFALTKPDVRKNVTDLYTLKACRPDPVDPKKKKEAHLKFLVNAKPETKQTNSTGHDSGEMIKDGANGQSTSIVKKVEYNADGDVNGNGNGNDNGKTKITFKKMINVMSSNDVKVKIDRREGSEASDGYNSNVFEFDEADAPIVHAIGSDHRVRRNSSIVFGRFKRSESRRNSSAELAQAAEQVRNTIATDRLRSSMTEQYRENQSLSASEPFDLRTIKFDDEASPGPFVRNTRHSMSSVMIGEHTTSDVHSESSIKSSLTASQQTSNDDASAGAVASAITKNHRESEKTETFNFFMDRNSICDSMGTNSSDLTDPKKRRRWLTGLRKNINDLGRMLHKTDVTEEEKIVYRQSIYLTKKALEIASSLEALRERRHSSLDSNVTGSSGDSEVSCNVEETGKNSTDDPSSEFVRLSSELFSDENSTSSTRTSFGSDDNGTTVVDVDGNGDGDSDNNGDGEWLFSKDQWLTELRRNIDDLSIRLEKENLTEDERAMVSRAIESQKATLSSIESLVGGDIDTVLFSSRNKRSNKSSNTVDHSNNSAFVYPSLEVIDDNSDTDTAN